MPIRTIYSYPDNNPYKAGDTVYYKGEKCTVGADYEELRKWNVEESENHIVTTSGRVLHIDEVSFYPPPKQQSKI